MTYSNTLKSVVSQKKPQIDTHSDLTGRFETKRVSDLSWEEKSNTVMGLIGQPRSALLRCTDLFHRLWQFIGGQGETQKLPLFSIHPKTKVMGILEEKNFFMKCPHCLKEFEQGFCEQKKKNRLDLIVNIIEYDNINKEINLKEFFKIAKSKGYRFSRKTFTKDLK